MAGKVDVCMKYCIDTEFHGLTPRILMYVPQFPMPIVGGLERQALILSKNLVEKGIDVYVLSGKISGVNCYSEHNSINIYRVMWPNNRYFRALTSMFFFTKYFIKNKNNFDILHIHQLSFGSLYLLALGKLLKKKIVVKLANFGEYGIPKLEKGFLGYFKISLLKKANCIVSMSNISFRELSSIGFKREKIFSVTNGVTISKIERVFHNELPIKVLAAGRLSSEKGYPYLLKAWKQVIASTNVPIELDICGDGSLKDELKQISNDLGIINTITFHGNVDNINHFMESASIFVNTSTHEGNSNSILEAMSAGLPIVATAVGGTPMLVGSEGESLLCKPGDVESLTKNLLLLIDNSNIRNFKGSSMKSRVEENFNINKITDQYICMYKHVASGEDKNIIECCNKNLLQGLIDEA